MKELYLQKFIKSHPDWEKILSEKPYGLTISRNDGYILFKYDMIDSNFTIPEVCEARGIIFKEKDWRCVCHPFDKFFNAGESYVATIDWATSNVSEKIDGSIMKLWFDNGKWHISTNGTIDAFKANLAGGLKFKTFGDLAIAAMPIDFEKFTAKMNKTHTYMFELVSPYNRIVIGYDETKLYFLGERDMISDQEILPENSVWFKSIDFKMDIPKRFNLHSRNDIENAAALLPWDEEGYVVVDANFHRCKIKSPAYVHAHFARNNNVITNERLMKVILEHSEDDFGVYCSDYLDELNKVKTAYASMLDQIKDAIKQIEPENFQDKKSLAQVVLTYPRWMHSFLFNWNKLDETLKKITAKKWIDLMIEAKLLNQEQEIKPTKAKTLSK